MTLRVKGKTYEEIADEVGIHWETAMDTVERVLLRTRGKADALADQAREIELRRCAAIIASLWDRATDPARRRGAGSAAGRGATVPRSAGAGRARRRCAPSRAG